MSKLPNRMIDYASLAGDVVEWGAIDMPGIAKLYGVTMAELNRLMETPAYQTAERSYKQVQKSGVNPEIKQMALETLRVDVLPTMTEIVTDSSQNAKDRIEAAKVIANLSGALAQAPVPQTELGGKHSNVPLLHLHIGNTNNIINLADGLPTIDLRLVD